MDKKISILVVDDHELVKSGIISLLITGEDFEVVGEAETAKEAMEKITALKPDVALLDISLPDLTGIDVITELKKDASCTTKFLVITMFDTKEYIYRAVKAGAMGIISKNIAKQELFTSIRDVNSGKLYFGEKISHAEVAKIIQRLDEERFAENDPENIYLTEREKEVLYYLHEGLLSKQVAEALKISPRTVDIHRSNLMQKFSVTNMAELFAKIETSEKLKRMIYSGVGPAAKRQ